MKDRDAVATLKGYFYQFDFTILQLLRLNNINDIVMVEGIEDVDITSEDCKTAIQCKYYESTEYNHSEIAEAIRYFLNDYVERKNKNLKEIKYMLYGYYSKGQEKLPSLIDVPFLKAKFLTHRRKKDGGGYEKFKEYELLALSDIEIESFLKSLKIDVNAQKIETQLQEIYKQIIDIFHCTMFEAEHYYYNNALKIIKNISICSQAKDREISKGNFLKSMDNKELLFNQWFYAFRSQKEVFRKIRKEFFTFLNVAPYERFFLIDVGDGEFDLVLLKDLIYLIIRKWSKQTLRSNELYCPYVYLHNISEEQLAIIKKDLYRENIIFIDGYLFYKSDFYVDELVAPVTHENKIQLKFINELSMIEDVIKKTKKRVEIYQFYRNKAFYSGLDNIKQIKIQIMKLDNVKEII